MALTLQGAKLEIPVFTRGKSQLEVEHSKQLSTVLNKSLDS